jgi:deoxycytidylate deaminase
MIENGQIRNPRILADAKRLAMTQPFVVKSSKFRLVAILIRNKTIVKMGTPTWKTHPSFGRRYQGHEDAYALHAEMNVLRFAKPGDHIVVMRFLANGELAISKPCPHCQKFIKQHEIDRVTYVDIDGKFVTEKTKNLC